MYEVKFSKKAGKAYKKLPGDARIRIDQKISYHRNSPRGPETKKLAGMQNAYHGKHGGKETKAEIHFLHGRISKITLKDKGSGLELKKRKEFEDFVNAYASEIVDKWVDYFVNKKPITPKIITQKVKNVRTFS